MNIKLVFNLFKLKSYCSYKDPVPDDLKSFLVYKFARTSCSSSYIGETCRRFETRKSDQFFSGDQYFYPTNKFTRLKLTPTKNFYQLLFLLNKN